MGESAVLVRCCLYCYCTDLSPKTYILKRMSLEHNVHKGSSHDVIDADNAYNYGNRDGCIFYLCLETAHCHTFSCVFVANKWILAFVRRLKVYLVGY